jgi:hypothetical protein
VSTLCAVYCVGGWRGTASPLLVAIASTRVVSLLPYPPPPFLLTPTPTNIVDTQTRCMGQVETAGACF